MAKKCSGGALTSPFEHYCRERWQFNASRARQLIGSVGVIENLKSVTQVTPTTEKNISPIGENEEIPESQLRPLTKLEPEQQKEARHSILCLLSRWQGRIKKSETGKSQRRDSNPEPADYESCTPYCPDGDKARYGDKMGTKSLFQVS